MVAGVGDGFRALARSGVTVQPAPLRTIFTKVPSFISVPYWQRQLQGDLGRLSLGPQAVATADTEHPALSADVRRLLAGELPVPALEFLLAAP